MKIIEINSSKYGKFECLVDDEDFEELLKYKFRIYKSRANIYVNTRLNGKDAYRS